MREGLATKRLTERQNGHCLPVASFLRVSRTAMAGKAARIRFDIGGYRFPMLFDALAQQPGDRLGDAPVLFPPEAVD